MLQELERRTQISNISIKKDGFVNIMKKLMIVHINKKKKMGEVCYERK
jgi:hypothetical protein